MDEATSIAMVTAVTGAIVTVSMGIIGYFTLAKKTALDNWESKLSEAKNRIIILETAVSDLENREDKCRQDNAECQIRLARTEARLEWLEGKK